MVKLYAITERNNRLAEGFNRVMAYAWSDGFVQRALFNVEQAREHFEWMHSFPVAVARHRWTRDVATGRFVSPK